MNTVARIRMDKEPEGTDHLLVPSGAPIVR